jgi:hypothetical protein
MMRRTVVFYVDECQEFDPPLPGVAGPLAGTKVVRCLLGLVLTLTADLLQVFSRDDVEFHLHLVAPESGSSLRAAERRQIVEVLHLLLREKEEQGKARIDVLSGELSDLVDRAQREAGRHLSVVAFSRPERVRSLRRPGGQPDLRVVPVAVHVPQREEAVDGVNLTFGGDPVEALQAARSEILARVIG